MKRISRWTGGFSLVEVTLALAVAAFCLLAIFGLLPVGLNSNQNAIEQTAAAGIATGIFADMRATPITSGTTANYKISIPNATTATAQQIFLREDGSLDLGPPPGANARYLGYLTFKVPPQPKAATSVRLLITWPAAADLGNNPPKNYSGSFEVVSALDRN